MTRKDYEVIAIALAQAWGEAQGKEVSGVEKAIEHVAHALQVDNSRFVPVRFIKLIRQEIAKVMDSFRKEWQ